MVNDSHRLHSRQVVGGFLDAEANGLLEEQQPPPQMPVVVDTEKEQKGQAIMDALLTMFTTKVNEEEIKKDDSLSPEQLPTPTSPH
ncbi:uncharacterized protein LOC127565606 isoform X2 [Drosophila albomicans]|uniref:Uncharacterized protein LOC127565606 isoform X2 n=1 Tax=Drosophila albomicans TaxID=7291 RepID=A0A9C6SW28_DROAB|nr:uncharacterized protein LOC127565606 isoform X2 [Drosophila albomicans]